MQGVCEGCDPDADGAVKTATSLLQTDSAPEVMRKHEAWWRRFWSTGVVMDLGANHSALEGFVYGSHYHVGSAARAGRNAPPLFGPWAASNTGTEMFVLNCTLTRLTLPFGCDGL